MMINKLYAYNRFSKSGKVLADALGVKRIKHQNSRWRPRHGKVVLNWGSTDLPAELGITTVINNPASVRSASNKVTSLQMFQQADVPCPEFTTSVETAREWAQDGIVVCRTLTRANSGRGIVIAEKPEDVVPAPLYTKYFKRKDEYRVHVIKGEVVDIQRKMRKHEVPDEEVNWLVRNHSNGFIFGRGGVYAPDAVVDAALKAVQALDLDFGAADVGYNEHYNQAVVFEVNTAPGLEGTTLEKYVQAFA
ncbi:MAG: hypothetical protein OQK25_03845 [Gammaproteobacteria bacterium]|nr:hypothetical protein [Gammaproteobacteria bacterium]MCW8982470.1 hypothetical protein [Gammaproteobacteria bacterium]